MSMQYLGHTYWKNIVVYLELRLKWVFVFNLAILARLSLHTGGYRHRRKSAPEIRVCVSRQHRHNLYCYIIHFFLLCCFEINLHDLSVLKMESKVVQSVFFESGHLRVFIFICLHGKIASPSSSFIFSSVK